MLTIAIVFAIISGIGFAFLVPVKPGRNMKTSLPAVKEIETPKGPLLDPELKDLDRLREEYGAVKIETRLSLIDDRVVVCFAHWVRKSEDSDKFIWKASIEDDSLKVLWRKRRLRAEEVLRAKVKV